MSIVIQSEQCEYCHSMELLEHSEGVTCSNCSRLSRIPRHITPAFEMCYNIVPQYDYANDIFSEIDCRTGIPASIRNRANHLFHKVKNIFKTTSNIDIILIAILQSYNEKRIFISFFRLREFYITQASDSTLNNLHFKMVSRNIFKYTPSFNVNEIMDAIFSHFRMSHVCRAMVTLNYNKLLPILKHNTTSIIIGCAFQNSSTKNKIDGCVGMIDILNFLSLKKQTIMSKIRFCNKNNK